MKIKLHLFFSAIALCIYSACSSPGKEQDHTVASDSIKSKPLPPDPNNPVLQVDKPCIVFLWPDSIEMDKMKTKDSDAFYTEVDDYTFYTSQIMTLADSLDIANFSTDKNSIDFKTKDNKHIIIDRSKLKEEDRSWGAYIFNGVDTPQVNSSIDMDKTFLKKFFNK